MRYVQGLPLPPGPSRSQPLVSAVDRSMLISDSIFIEGYVWYRITTGRNDPWTLGTPLGVYKPIIMLSTAAARSAHHRNP